MARLAADAQTVPLAGKAIAHGVEIALETRGMAFDTHEVGVLARLAPVQGILEVHTLAWIEMKPAMFLGIPGHPQRLQPPAGCLYQILLQGGDAEGVSDFEISGFTVCARSVDPETVIFMRETGGLSLVFERDVTEIGEDRFSVSRLHGQLVMRALPIAYLRAVATLALLLVDHFCCWRGSCFQRLWC